MKLKNNSKKNYIFYLANLFLIILILFLIFVSPGQKGSLIDEVKILSNKKSFYYEMQGKKKNISNVINDLFKINFKNKNENDLITIDMKQKNLNILLEDRRKSLGLFKHDQYLLGRNKVPLKITYNGKVYKASARLKGDRADHWKNNKRFSLQIEIKNKDSLDTFQKFSLITHERRQFPQGEVMSLAASRQGLITSKFKTYKVIFNGSNWGQMYLEESYSSGFYEKRKLKETPISKFTNSEKDKIIAKIANKKFTRDVISNLFEKYSVSEIDPYKRKKYIKNDDNIKQLSFLEHINFYSKKKNLSKNQIKQLKYFLNKEKFARHLAINTLFNDWHSSYIHNTRFYLDPFLNKVEPVPSDFMGQAWHNDFGIIKSYDSFLLRLQLLPNIYKILLDDPEFQNFYLVSLKKFIKDIPNMKQDLARICENDNSCMSIDFDKLVRNFDLIKSKLINIDQLNEKKKVIKKNIFKEKDLDLINNKIINNTNIFVYSRFYKNGEIYLENLNSIPITINEIIFNNCKKSVSTKIFVNSSSKLNLKLNKNDIICVKDSKTYEIIGNIKDKYFRQEFIIHDTKFLKDNFFSIEIDEINPEYIDKIKNDEIFLKSGKHAIEKPIVLYNKSLSVPKNTNLIFSPNSYIKIINGDLKLLGTEKHPILLSSNNEKIFWKGIYVLNSNNSKIFNTNINNITYFKDNKFTQLTGGINFHSSNLEINNLVINNILSEDGINITKSNIDVKNLIISNALSDGVDLDFCKGKIEFYYTENIQGDSLDVSGSQITLKNFVINNAGDKGISIGEASNLDIYDGNISNAEIGVAIKDKSQAKIKNLNFFDNMADIALYRKKSFYEVGGTLLIDNKVLRNIKVEKDRFSNIFEYEKQN